MGGWGDGGMGGWGDGGMGGWGAEVQKGIGDRGALNYIKSIIQAIAWMKMSLSSLKRARGHGK